MKTHILLTSLCLFLGAFLIGMPAQAAPIGQNSGQTTTNWTCSKGGTDPEGTCLCQGGKNSLDCKLMDKHGSCEAGAELDCETATGANLCTCKFSVSAQSTTLPSGTTSQWSCSGSTTSEFGFCRCKGGFNSPDCKEMRRKGSCDSDMGWGCSGSGSDQVCSCNFEQATSLPPVFTGIEGYTISGGTSGEVSANQSASGAMVVTPTERAADDMEEEEPLLSATRGEEEPARGVTVATPADRAQDDMEEEEPIPVVTQGEEEPARGVTLAIPDGLGGDMIAVATNGSSCGTGMVTYVSTRSTGSADNSIICVKFFNNNARHNGFYWIAEKTVNGGRLRSFGRFTKGNRVTDFMVSMPWSNEPRGDVKAADFNVSYEDGVGAPDEIVFSGVIDDTWKKAEGAVPYQRTLNKNLVCEEGMMQFNVYQRSDGGLANPIGKRCVSSIHRSWYGYSIRDGRIYETVSTVSNFRDIWNEINVSPGLLMMATDICVGQPNCGTRDIHLGHACRSTSPYVGPSIIVEEWNEVWIPDFSGGRHLQDFGLSECGPE